MRIVQTRYLIRSGGYDGLDFWTQAFDDVSDAIRRITWPPEDPSGEFVINPQSGKKRGEGNGVVPIKDAFLKALKEKGWNVADRKNPDRFDAVKYMLDRKFVAAEWETGNISSSHRSLNRVLRAILTGASIGGMVVLPTRNLAQYLTDRVGNWEELIAYFSIYERQQIEHGVIAVIAFEHDRTDPGVPRIRKGTNGRALL